MKSVTALTLIILATPAIAQDNNPPGRGEFLWSAASKAAKDDGQCRSLGAQPGTPVYVQCRLVKDQQRADAIRGATAASQNFLRNFNANRPRNCTSEAIGSTVYTNCN